MTTRYWQSGDAIVLREIWRSRVWSARTVLVVADAPERIALCTLPGTIWKQPHDLAGNPQRQLVDDWRLADVVWEGLTSLRLVSPGAPHSVLLFWRGDEFRGWYVNLEEPLQRTALGFDYLDRELDVRIAPDGRAEWKDEDDLHDLVDRGLLSEGAAAAFRAEGERVLDAFRRRTGPFAEGWERWRPDPGWQPAPFPPGWEDEGPAHAFLTGPGPCTSVDRDTRSR